jgi:hypothetical protein
LLAGKVVSSTNVSVGRMRQKAWQNSHDLHLPRGHEA